MDSRFINYRTIDEQSTNDRNQRESTVDEPMIDLHSDFCCEIEENEGKNEIKNYENEKGEHTQSSFDSDFCTLDIEDSMTDDDEGITCLEDELFVEEVEDLKTEIRISSVVDDYDADLGISWRATSKNGRRRRKRY